MKKVLCVLLAAVMLLSLLTACAGQEPAPMASTASPTETTQAPSWTDILYADFSCGSVSDDSIREYPISYTGSRKTAQELADELSQLTGLDFAITAAQTEDGWVIDWSADSTLVAGLDDREQKEDFFFFDYDSLCWFMLDSLWRTLTGNLEAENIYYTMKGGQELVVENMAYAGAFPVDIPYMGSPFYFAHDDGMGGEDEGLFACTQGLWRLDGAMDTPSIEMDGLGGFTLYYADGTIEATGYLGCEDEYGDGTYRYDLYTGDGEWLDGFYFDSDSQIHFGNSTEAVYLLDSQEAPTDVNTYYDEKTGFLLTYPCDFSSEGFRDENDIVYFYTLWDTGMCYWTDPNDYSLTPAEFRERMNLPETMELDGNVVIGYGDVENSSGEPVPTAFYWVVDTDIVVNVMILCGDQEEAAYWYSQFQNQAFYIENASGAYPIQ